MLPSLSDLEKPDDSKFGFPARHEPLVAVRTSLLTFPSAAEAGAELC